MIDLTTLEGTDTRARSRRCAPRRCRPDPADPTAPPVAAVCVYPDLVADRRSSGCGGSGGQGRRASRPRSRRAAPSLAVKLADTRDAVAAGADEIDMVIDRGAFLSGRYLAVFDEIVAVKDGLRARRTSR